MSIQAMREIDFRALVLGCKEQTECPRAGKSPITYMPFGVPGVCVPGPNVRDIVTTLCVWFRVRGRRGTRDEIARRGAPWRHGRC